MARDWIGSQSKPSFKGIPFEVDIDTIASGRRLATHEYPSSEFWDVEDLGRRPFVVTVNGYVAGDDADTQAKALEAALSSQQTGTLVLPTRAQQTAWCSLFTSDWTAEKMGRVEFRMEFVCVSRVAGGIVPSADTGNQVAVQADRSSAAVTDRFSQDFNSTNRSFSPGESPIGVPASARLAAGVTIAMAGEELGRALLAVGISDPTSAAQALFGVRQIRERAESFAQQGQSPYRIDELVFIDDQADSASAFSRVFSDTLRLMSLKADNPGVLVAALEPMLTFEAQTLTNTSDDALTVRAERALIADVASLVRRLTLIRWAQAISRVKYVSRADATSAKGRLAPAFSDELSTSPSPAITDALRGIMGAATNFLIRNGAQLPRTLTIESANGLPACVLAYILYQDASRDAELWMRNGIENHPLNLPTKIEALAP
jgi:prophage DNA circulation protein